MDTIKETEVLDNEAVQDRAYGLIPIRVIPSTSPVREPVSTISTANTQVLLIKGRPGPHSRKLPYWGFPKGHAESYDLSNLHTAIREVKEETGLVIPETRILFKDAKGLIERHRRTSNGCVKEVQYWVGQAEWFGDAEINIQEEEVLDARWLDWQEALTLIANGRAGPLRTAMALLDRSS
jgi:8-oxo-dGTP pyrophosphatase MutT (NUDIX family)